MKLLTQQVAYEFIKLVIQASDDAEAASNPIPRLLAFHQSIQKNRGIVMALLARLEDVK